MKTSRIYDSVENMDLHRKYKFSMYENLDTVLNEFAESEKIANENLHTIMTKHTIIDSKMNSIGRALKSLGVTNSHSKILSSQIMKTADLAETVSGKVRSLDVARTRASECQQRVNDLIDLQLCSQGVVSALNQEDFEKAAGHISRFLAMDKILLQKTADDVQGSVTSVSKSLQMLEQATENMREILDQRFDEAVKRDDLASVERFFKMFPLVGMHMKGIEKFTKYVCDKLNLKASKELANVMNTAKSENRMSLAYADILTTILENIARVIEVNIPIIEVHYGKGFLLNMVMILQKECDVEVKNLIGEFQKNRKISATIQQINENKKPYSNASPAQSQALGHYRKASSALPDPKDIDIICGEITVMHQRFELYIRFVRRKVLSDIESCQNKTNSEIEIDKLNSILNKSSLAVNMQELLSTYIQFERYFMEESFKKAIQLDTWETNQHCSTMVDDVFFILRKSIRRSLGTQSINGICAVVNNAAACVDGDYINCLRSSLKSGFPSGYLDLAQAYNALQNTFQQGKLQSADNDRAKTHFIVQINNADVSTEYMEALWQTTRQDICEIFPNMSKLEKQMLDNSISELKANQESLKTCVDFGMQQLRSNALKPRIHPWVDEFLKYNHYLTEEELAEYEAGETFIQYLILQIDKLLNYFRALLTPRIFNSLVSLLATDVTSRLERVIKKCTFNRLGGLLLDQEMRVLSSYFTNATSWSVRDKMTRITQITTLLNLESISEIKDYFNPDDTSTWRITPTEIKIILSLRSDFRMEEIKKLKLDAKSIN